MPHGMGRACSSAEWPSITSRKAERSLFGDGLLRLTDHPKNREAAERAAQGYCSPGDSYRSSTASPPTERPRDDGGYLGPPTLRAHQGEAASGRIRADRATWRQPAVPVVQGEAKFRLCQAEQAVSAEAATAQRAV